MPAIVATSIKALGTIPVTETILNGSDSLIHKRGAILTLRNPTGGALSPVIDGDGSTSSEIDGIGTVTTSGGFLVGSIAAGDIVAIRLDTISEYLKGVIAINSGSALIATLLEP